jgi:hypothetical protein
MASDEELDRQLFERHEKGHEFARRICGLFEQVWRGQEPVIGLAYSIHERSQRRSEIEFSMGLQGPSGWQVFPRMVLSSEPNLTVEMRLLYNGEDGRAVVERHTSPEAFVASLAYRLRLVSGTAPAEHHDRRLSPRETINMPAIIRFGDDGMHLQAVIINRSREGYMAQMMVRVELPETIDLLLDGQTIRCSTVWQNGGLIGLLVQRSDVPA